MWGKVEGVAAGPLRLLDVIAQIDAFDDELAIYAATEWTPRSPVVVAFEPDGGGVPAEAAAAGMCYFLEIFAVKEVLDGFPQLGLDAKAARVIDYAINDA